MSWYLVLTKPRQERRALDNLFNQGYECWLPQLRVEKVRQRKLTVVDEPLFPRYLFIHLPPGINWAPVRSTLGVTTIVRFGGLPARVPPAVMELLRAEEAARREAPVRPKFERGQVVQILTGPFVGLRAVFDMSDGEARAMVLIELLSKQTTLPVAVAALRAVREDEIAEAPSEEAA
ncbi:MAG: transcription/translation regulatory transformer protein RfaH [Rubrivivax sp.]